MLLLKNKMWYELVYLSPNLLASSISYTVIFSLESIAMGSKSESLQADGKMYAK